MSSSSPSFFFWVELIALVVMSISMIVGGLAYRRNKLDPKKKAIGAVIACLGGIILMVIGIMFMLSYMIAGTLK